jgi:dolichol kinase
MQPHQQPSNLFVLEYLISVSVIASFSFIAFKSSRSPKDLLKACGVSMRKVASAAREIERKTFHIAGLLVPLIHQILLSHKVSNRFCVQIVVTIAAVGGACDFARLHVPFVAANWPLAHILRDDEKKQLTGGTWYAWGCTLTMAISPPSIAITSILFLVLGDMSAAIIGVSFGREVSTVRIGRGGRKSMEGAVAMFAVCFVIGSTMFASVNLREYPVFFGALAATLTEVYEPLGLNDNLTIPFFASLAMQWGFARIQSCASEPPLHWILNGDMWTQLQRLPLA